MGAEQRRQSRREWGGRTASTGAQLTCSWAQAALSKDRERREGEMPTRPDRHSFLGGGGGAGYSTANDNSTRSPDEIDQRSVGRLDEKVIPR